MKTLLWLDDYRDPLKDDWLNFSPIGRECAVVWVKNYEEFICYIRTNGLPEAICFDHDLSDIQAFTTGFPEMMEGIDIPESEKTGMDCAKWLVDYCIDNNVVLPLYAIQSANPAGKENIDSLLKNFKKHQQNEQ